MQQIIANQLDTTKLELHKKMGQNIRVFLFFPYIKKGGKNHSDHSEPAGNDKA
jgi:hypothetical protein